MTITDLRIAFKMNTGEYPLWAKNHDGRSDYGTGFTKGVPRSIYGDWLEDQSGKRSKYLRDLYYDRNRDLPTRDYFRGTGPGKDVLIQDYILWLETFILKFRPEVVTVITGVK
jgi:hypothetical protein